MSESKRSNTRKQLDDSDDEDDEEPYETPKDVARRFLWDEDEDDAATAPTADSMMKMGSAHEIDLENSFASSISDHVGTLPIRKQRRSVLGTSADLKFSDPSVARSSMEYNKRKGGLQTACQNCYYCILGCFGVCFDFIFSRNMIKYIVFLFILAGITIGASYAVLNPQTKQDEEIPSPPEPVPAPTSAPVEVAPEEVSNGSRREDITQILEANPAIDAMSYINTNTPQQKALNWLVDVDTFRGEDSVSHRYALAAIYFSTGGKLSGTTPDNSWTNDDGWMTGTSFCNWYGVECADNRVVKLILSENNLKGVMAAEIGALDSLQTLDLHKNKLFGSIAKDITNLVHLNYLNLMENQLRDAVPDFQNMTSLREANLGKNFLTSVSGTGFSGLTELVALGLQKNRLLGSIEDLKFPSSSLEILYLDDNQLEGTIPDFIYGMTRLRELRVDKNDLGGTISEQIKELSNLVILKLDANSFKGSFPDVFDRMPKLVELFLVRNVFTGSIPPSITSLTNLEKLLLAENKFSGSLPGGMQMMTSLKEIYLPENELTGTLPNMFGEMSDLTVVKIEKNQFNGRIPPTLALCPNLKDLILEQNNFNGQVPAGLGNLEALKTVALEKNQLTGDIPSGLCSLVDSGSLKFLAADCQREGGVNCECCHMCW